MNRIVEWFARNGVAANLLLVAILGGGVYSAFNHVTLQEFPDTEIRTVTVRVPYRGATPFEVEQGIVLRLEEALYDIEGIKEMASTATGSAGVVTLDIYEGHDLGEVLDEVNNRVGAISTFPAEAERPVVSLGRITERVITIVVSGGMTERELTRLGEQVRDEVSSLPGVTMAALKAVRPYEISVEVSESTLKKYGLTFDEITRAVRTSSVDLSAGSIRSEGGNVLLRTRSQAYSGEEFARIVVLTRDDGSRVTLGDIAVVNDGFDETPIESRFNGSRAVAVDVFRTGSQSVIELGAAVKRYVGELELRLPDGARVEALADDSERVVQRLDTLSSNAIFGFALVLLSLSLFLRPSVALWVAVGIPVAFAGAFLVFPLFGVSLNLVTLFAFILVLGIVVDDAIVTGENVYRHMRRGEPPLTAAIRGTQEITVPVVFGVLTTVAAFTPLLLLSGTRGQMFKQIPLVVIPVLLFSLIESKLILPSHLKHCRGLGRKDEERASGILRFQRFFADGLERFVRRFYNPALEACLRHRYLTAAGFLCVLAVFVGLVFGGRFSYTDFPRIPRDSVTVTLAMPAGTTFERTRAIIDRIERAALDLKAEVNAKHGKPVVAHIFATAGGRPFGGGGFRSNATAGIAEQGEVVIELTPAELTGATYGVADVARTMRARVGPIPEAEQLNFAFQRGASGAISAQIYSPHFADLREASEIIKKRFSEFEGVYDVEDSFERAADEFELHLEPEAGHLGVTAGDLARQVRQAFFGAEAQRIQRGRDDVRVMIRYPEAQRRSIDTLRTMTIRTPDGAEVPFELVAEARPSRSLPSIQRVNRNRILRVTADADQDRINIDAVQGEINQRFLPEVVARFPGMGVLLDGRERDSRNNRAEFLRGIVFVLCALYALLAIPLKSYLQPLIVMSAIPFGVIGALLGHVIQGKDLSMMSLLGVLALAGVAVNDSLVLVDYINQRRREGMSMAEAVRTAAPMRFRAILLTSLTTFLGLYTLMNETSSQAQFMVPMAVSLGWGVVFATIITLFLVPVLVLVLEDVRVFFCRLYDVDPRGHLEAGLREDRELAGVAAERMSSAPTGPPDARPEA